jgi:hypothetical protein
LNRNWNVYQSKVTQDVELSAPKDPFANLDRRTFVEKGIMGFLAQNQNSANSRFGQ